MHQSSPTTSDGVVERTFTVGDVPGVLWSPPDAPPGTPVLLSGHGGSLSKRAPGVVARARHTVQREGFHVAAIDAPGHGDRPRSAEDARAVDAIRVARQSGAPLDPVLIPLTISLVARAVPEWQATMDALQSAPELGPDTRFAWSGMTLATATGVALAAADSRVRAAVFGSTVVYDELFAAARSVTVPLQFLLPWDDDELPRAAGIGLFDAFASADKLLLAFPGDHRHVPGQRLDTRFLTRVFAD